MVSGVAAGPSAVAPTRLIATVGPAAQITLTNAAGRRVTALKPGRYRIAVWDRSARDNFHLVGPGVNRQTGVEAIGAVTWALRLVRGEYRFVCDPHLDEMYGGFRVEP